VFVADFEVVVVVIVVAVIGAAPFIVERNTLGVCPYVVLFYLRWSACDESTGLLRGSRRTRRRRRGYSAGVLSRGG
jgi:hypothetical protein